MGVCEDSECGFLMFSEFFFFVPVEPVTVTFVLAVVLCDSQTPQSHQGSLHCCQVFPYNQQIRGRKCSGQIIEKLNKKKLPNIQNTKCEDKLTENVHNKIWLQRYHEGMIFFSRNREDDQSFWGNWIHRY